MHIIHLDHIAITYGGRNIFSDLNWSIGSRDRTGLIGPNGSGKSSLLKVIAGHLQTDAGLLRHTSIERGQPVRIGYLPQEITFPPDLTVIDVAQTLPPMPMYTFGFNHSDIYMLG